MDDEKRRFPRCGSRQNPHNRKVAAVFDFAPRLELGALSDSEILDDEKRRFLRLDPGALSDSGISG